jgi:lysozyme
MLNPIELKVCEGQGKLPQGSTIRHKPIPRHRPNMETLKDRIKRHEGRRLFPYQDTTGHTTIGFGRNLTGRGISAEEAEMMLESDIGSARHRIDLLPLEVREKCNQAREDILTEMVFQLGYMGVLKFKRMLGAIAAGDFERASKEMLRSKWAEQTPRRCAEMSEIMKMG